MSFQWPDRPISSPEVRNALRQVILEQISAATSGHPGGSLSLVEILAAIFDGNFERKNLKEISDEDDRFVLSKGHGVPALYSVMSYLKFFDAAELVNLRRLGHFLQGHPDRFQYPLMEASTGSLGQGVSVALGIALGTRLSFERKEIKRLPRVYCILGDGEMQEGQVWESLMAAGKFLPGNLIFILDYNKGQIDGPVSEIMDLEPLPEKIRAFKWNTVVCDGHDVSALKKVFSSVEIQAHGKPTFVIANTLKGKGISFMEHPTKWHGAAPSREQVNQAILELYGKAQSPYGRLLQD